jgi:riboflavin synthase
MFTGLIEEIGLIRSVRSNADGADLVISARKVIPGLACGDSMAVSGPCLTVTKIEGDNFTAWAMPETLQKTNLRHLKNGHAVNLERAMALGERLGGHLVSGHIDDVVILTSRKPQGGAVILTFEAPAHLLRYIIPKGSVALDGVSLTVIDVSQHGFSVGLIPHTAEQTTLIKRENGSAVNLEVDMIGKYVEKMLMPRNVGLEDKKEAAMMTLLMQNGYIQP